MTIKRVIAKAPPVQPIRIGCFTLTETGLDVRGQPAFEEYQDVGEFIRRAHKASGWWLADWIAYGDSRPEWKDLVDATLGIDQLTDQTVRQYRDIAKAVPVSRRLDGVAFALHAEVASLEPAEQTAWLTRAKVEGWSQSELRREIRAAKRAATVIEGQADSVYDVDVTVCMSVEAVNAYAAEKLAWELLKGILEHRGDNRKILSAKVTAAHALGKATE